MAWVNIYATYSINVPEIDEIYDEYDDTDVVDTNVDNILQEIQDNPTYFIERDGYELTIDDVTI